MLRKNIIAYSCCTSLFYSRIKLDTFLDTFCWTEYLLKRRDKKESCRSSETRIMLWSWSGRNWENCNIKNSSMNKEHCLCCNRGCIKIKEIWFVKMGNSTVIYREGLWEKCVGLDFSQGTILFVFVKCSFYSVSGYKVQGFSWSLSLWGTSVSKQCIIKLLIMQSIYVSFKLAINKKNILCFVSQDLGHNKSQIA